MRALDHFFLLLFVVAYPVAGLAGFRRLMRRKAAGFNIDRKRIYRSTMLGHWLLLLAGVIVWGLADRSWALLGLYRAFDWRFAVGVLAVIAVAAGLLQQLRQLAKADSETVAGLYGRFGNLATIVPRTRAELHEFYAVSFTAGIVEEILWRGFLIWYLAQWWPPAVAAVVATLAFGVAHSYQGWRQVSMITAVSAGLTALYLFTGTLWLSIVTHMLIDMLQGRLAFGIHRRHADMTATVRYP